MATVTPTSERRAAKPFVALRTDQARAAAVRLAVPLALAAAWAIVATSSSLVPSIGATASSLVHELAHGHMASALLATLKAVGIGFAVALVIGLAIGMGLGRSRLAFRVFEPLLNGLFAIPRIILYPVLLVAFGVGLQSKVWMVAISAVFPIALNTLAGVRDIDPTLVKLGRSIGCSRRHLVLKMYVPAALPAIMVGVRLGISIAFVSAIIAELFAAQDGLGQLIQQYYGLQQYAPMFAAVALITGVALILNLVAWTLERRLNRELS